MSSTLEEIATRRICWRTMRKSKLAATFEEQDNAISNFNETVDQPGIVAATSSSASEELASTAELLNSEAQNLNTIINFFKLKGVETQ